jgi:hypothetical protein
MTEDGSYEEMAIGARISWCRLDDPCLVPRVSAASNHQQLPWLFLGEVVGTEWRYCSIFVDSVDV